MKMDDEFDWEEIAQLEHQTLIDNAEDPLFFGQANNQYNPEIHIGCLIEGVTNLSDLVQELSQLVEILEDLDNVGWELARPVEGGLVYTEWRGEGQPPKEYSMFDESGNDLDGNNIHDLYGEDDD